MSKRVKIGIVLLLVAVLAVFLLAGCSKSQERTQQMIDEYTSQYPKPLLVSREVTVPIGARTLVPGTDDIYVEISLRDGSQVAWRLGGHAETDDEEDSQWQKLGNNNMDEEADCPLAIFPVRGVVIHIKDIQGGYRNFRSDSAEKAEYVTLTIVEPAIRSD